MTNWRPSLEKIRIMRSAKDAPVDVIGCHMLHDKNEAKNVFSSFITSNSSRYKGSKSF